jgi:hypothetical protein
LTHEVPWLRPGHLVVVTAVAALTALGAAGCGSSATRAGTGPSTTTSGRTTPTPDGQTARYAARVGRVCAAFEPALREAHHAMDAAANATPAAARRRALPAFSRASAAVNAGLTTLEDMHSPAAAAPAAQKFVRSLDDIATPFSNAAQALDARKLDAARQADAAARITERLVAGYARSAGLTGCAALGK